MRFSTIAGLAGLLAVLGCTNNPYPDVDQDQKVLYSSFSEAPKTLDPAVAYTTAEHVVTGTVYDTLLEYHYLRRPYELIPGLAEAVPKPETQAGERQTYRFKLRRGVLFHADPCFALSQKDRNTREVLAADVAFQLARLADPAVNSPVASTFADILGFTDFAKRLSDLRKTDPTFTSLPIQEQYKRAGGIEGVVVRGDVELDIVLAGPNPQILYWFAMPFTTPMPWEAVAYYDGKDGRPNFSDHAVGTGAFRLTVYERQHRFVLERNLNWYGTLHPEAKAPGATFPTQIDQADIDAGRIDPAYAGRALAVPGPHQLLARARRHPALQQVPAGLLRRRRHHQGKLRCHRQGRPAVAGNGGARHAPRYGGGADGLLRRLQHGRCGRRRTQQAIDPAICVRP